MAILRFENGTTLTDRTSIATELAPLGITLNHWTIGENEELKALLAKASLSDSEKAEILTALDHYFAHLQNGAGYQTRDLIVLHPETPNLDELLAKFDRIHTHDDDEVRYIIEGEGVFGFVHPDGSQIKLTVQPEEYINVPAGIEHWFYLTETKRIKAIRYFTDPIGWIPHYTETQVRTHAVLV